MSNPELNFTPKQSVLSQEQIERIYSATLEILERIGSKITCPQALEILEAGGARINGDRVRIPNWLVEDALRKAPSRIALGNREGKRTVILDKDSVYFSAAIDNLEYLEPISNERIRYTSEHTKICASLADGLPNFSWIFTINMAHDYPPLIADRAAAREVLTHCSKPYICCCNDAQSMQDIYEMAVLIAGGEEKFRQAPNLGLFNQPVAPLVHGDPVVEKAIFCAEKSIPLIYYSAEMAGGNAPMTLAGLLAQGGAESLTGLVLTQLINPGTPFIFGTFTTVIDMMTTVFSYGAPEMSLMAAAMSQISHYCNLPFFGTAGCSDAKFPDQQAAAEAAFSCFSSALSRGNLIHDPGWLDHGSLASPANLVLVDEVLDMIKHYMQGIPVSDETLAVDLIEEVGPAGEFLSQEHTRKHFREIWYPKIFDRSTLETWKEQGQKTFSQRLQEKTQEAMKHESAPVSSEILQEMEKMAKTWK